MVAAHTGHQFFVQFPDEANAKRQFLEPRYAVFQSHDVVGDLAQLIGAALDDRTRFGRQKLPKVACVPSILLDRTASRRAKGRKRTWGLGRRAPSPASLPMSLSASESSPTSRGVHSSTGGKGDGTKAE